SRRTAGPRRGRSRPKEVAMCAAVSPDGRIATPGRRPAFNAAPGPPHRHQTVITVAPSPNGDNGPPSPNGRNGRRRRRDTVTKRVVTVTGGVAPSPNGGNGHRRRRVKPGEGGQNRSAAGSYL